MTHKIIGILVSGVIDYDLHGDCYKTSVCRQDNSLHEERRQLLPVILNSSDQFLVCPVFPVLVVSYLSCNFQILYFFQEIF